MPRVLPALLLLVFLTQLSMSQEAAPVELSPDSAQVLLIRKVPPVYPPLARQARIQGTVVLQIVINKEGDVRDVRLVSGHPMLAPAAIEAVKQWKYQPYTQDGVAIEVSTNVRVNFNMADTPAVGTAGSVRSEIGAWVFTPGSYGSQTARVSEAEMRELRTSKIDPEYPPLALQQRIQGEVVLDVQINVAGDVENVKLISGHPVFVKPAIDAVKQWKYAPYVKDGTAMAAAGIVRMSFTIPAGESEGVVSEPPPAKLIKMSPTGDEPRTGVPQRVRVSSGVSQALLVKKVAPEYPEDARQQHIQGTVILQVRIDKEGNVYNADLVSGDPMLAPAAMEAVRQWKYRPYLLNGEAVEVETQVRVNFTLAE